jgi:AcrR family transcriptional regulator
VRPADCRQSLRNQCLRTGRFMWIDARSVAIRSFTGCVRIATVRTVASLQGYVVTPASQSIKKRPPAWDQEPAPTDEPSAEKRERILNAAFEAFVEGGFSGTSTLEIATRAKVSKRELYALVGSKEDMLVACISGRTARMRWTPGDAPEPRDLASLQAVLEAFGARLLTEVTHTTVIAVFQLAIAEANRAPEVARALETQGRDANRAPLKKILTQARDAGLLQGDIAEMTEQFLAVLWGNLMMGLLLRVADTPGPTEVKRRARSAAAALLKLHRV